MGVTSEDLIRYSDSVSEGSKVKISKNGMATILGKYSNIVVTDKGTFKWIDLYVANKGEGNV